jgi:hypothetical protein
MSHKRSFDPRRNRLHFESEVYHQSDEFEEEIWCVCVTTALGMGPSARLHPSVEAFVQGRDTTYY